MFLVRRIIEKLQCAHAYDNSELNDLFQDILTRRPTSLTQRIKRKMKYALKTLIYFFTVFTVLMVFGSNAFATNIPPRPDRGWYVRDSAHTMTDAQIQNLNQKIENFNRTTRNEIGILVTTPLGDDTNLENFAHDVFHSWGIGKKGLDNGILILMVTGAPGHKLIRIETGKGAEGDIPDAKTKDITTSMKPFMKNNDYAGAANVAVDTISALMDNRIHERSIAVDTNPLASPTSSHDTSTSSSSNYYSYSNETYSDATPIYVVLGLIAFIIFVLVWFWISDKKNIGVVRIDDPYIPPKPPRQNYNAPAVSPNGKTTYNYTAPTHVSRSIPTATGVVIGTASSVASVQVRREKQRAEDKARKARDNARSTSSSKRSSYDDDSSSGIGWGSTGGSWGGGDSGGGSGFGGGDSGGGGGSDSC